MQDPNQVRKDSPESGQPQGSDSVQLGILAHLDYLLDTVTAVVAFVRHAAGPSVINGQAGSPPGPAEPRRRKRKVR
jgi:hypothetical protein